MRVACVPAPLCAIEFSARLLDRVAGLAAMGRINYLQVHPNGRDSVIENSAFSSQVWALRNYLQKDKPASGPKAQDLRALRGQQC